MFIDFSEIQKTKNRVNLLAYIPITMMNAHAELWWSVHFLAWKPEHEIKSTFLTFASLHELKLPVNEAVQYKPKSYSYVYVTAIVMSSMDYYF